MTNDNNKKQQQGQQSQQQTQTVQPDRQRVVIDTNQYEKKNFEPTKTDKK